MNTHANKIQRNNSQLVDNKVSQTRKDGEKTFQFVDNRPEAVAQRHLQDMVNNSPQVRKLGAIQEMANACFRSNNTVIQAFAPKEYMKINIRDYKLNERIIGKGWDDDKIDKLVKWCKSEKQFNSFINNLSYKNWEVLSQDFQGADLPIKVMDSWVKYQESKMNVETLDTFEGYKGSSGKSWNTGESYSDWSGCYIATTEDQAKGYILEAGQKSGKASMWKISLKKPLPIKRFRGGFIDQSDIPGEFKAKVLKKILKIEDSKKLIKELGESGFAYLGPGGEDGNELVVPWGLIADYINYKRIKEYDVNDYQITNTQGVS